jgi:hypothetical protein
MPHNVSIRVALTECYAKVKAPSSTKCEIVTKFCQFVPP